MDRWLIAAAIAFSLVGCTPQTGLMLAALPEGTSSALLAHMQGVEDVNRRRIVELEQRGDWRGLIAFGEENIKRDPFTSDWWIVEGYGYTKLGEHENAARCYSELVRLEPDVTLGWTLLAGSYRAMGRHEQAIGVLEQALLVRQEEPDVLNLLGETYREMHRWREAARAYRQAVNVDSKLASGWYGLAISANAIGADEEVREARSALQKLDPALAQKLEDALRASR